MNARNARTRRCIVVFVAVLATACSGTAAPTGPAGETAAETAAAAAAPAGTPAPSSPAPPTSSPVAVPSPSAGASFVAPTVASFAPPTASSTEPWQLVALGDSNVAGWGVVSGEAYSPQAAFPGVYAGLLASEQGRPVVLHSYYPDQVGDEVRTVAEWANVVRTDPAMRADLAAADEVVLLVGFHDLLPAVLFGQCPSPSDAWADFSACVGKLTAPMPAAFDDLYGEVASLVPADAVKLVMDYGIPAPVYDQLSSASNWPEVKAVLFDGWLQAMADAAARHGFTMTHMSTLVNKPDGSPSAYGASLTSDGYHFNAKGHELLAEQMLKEDGIAVP
jgi:lysophospholipase L1-like esterase